ncbi:MAG: hypothetical protein IT287_09625, partial [Bdellovibrionaceae bacterium]|nr:hypothetical protein [Pseudobdellovibrionaceae bacterium]
MRIARLLFLIFTFTIIAFLTFGIFLSRYDLQLNADALQSQHKKYFDYRGITHVLTSYSQGGATPAEMVIDANKAKIDFIYITDYNDFNAEHALFNYNNDVAVFTAKKLSYLDSHFLVYSLQNLNQIDSIGSSHAMLSDLLNKVPTEAPAAFTVMAHPFKKGHEWTSGDYPSGMQGIEVMNLRHMWQQKWISSKASFAWSCLLYLFNPKVALLRLVQEPQKEIDLWDQLNQKQKTLGLLGSHATGRIFNLGPFAIPFPKYEDSFRFGSNHLLMKSELTGVYSLDAEKIHAAFTSGQFYFALDAVANPKGFAAYIKTKDRDYSMGENLKISQQPTLIVDVPRLNTKAVEIRIYKNGQEVHKIKDFHANWKIESPGVYRVQVRVRVQLPIPGELRW